MHAHWVEVLDGADDDGVVGEVAHDFQLELFPAEHALLYQDLVNRREVDAALQNLGEVFAIVGDAAAGSAERETRAQDDGVTGALCESQPVFDVVDELRLRRFQADLAHCVFEQQPVFGLLNRFDLRADQLHAVLVEHAGLRESDRQIETSLPADGRKQRIGPFTADDLFGELDGERLDVGAVRQLGIGHDGGGVGIDEDDFVAVGLERLTCLRAGVVELAGLADDDRAGTYNEHAMYVVTSWHICVYPRSSAARILHQGHEVVEQVVRIVRAGRRFRVILHPKDWLTPIPEALKGLVVAVNLLALDLPA